jgi:glucose dehydrogenase
MISLRRLALMGSILTVCLTTATAQSSAPANGRPARGYVPVTDEMLWKPDPSNWLSWRRTLDGWGYSPLDQIDRSNVSRLKMVWGRGMGTGTVEATPLVYDGVMYLPGPGDVIQAIDAKSGDLIWEHRRKLPQGINGGTNRNIAIWGSTLVDGSADNQIFVGTSVTIPAPKFLLAGNDKTYLYHNSTLALDADTGKIVWHYQHVVDHWDHDHPFERLLVDTVVAPDPKEVAWINPRLKAGERRKVMTGIPGKTGLVYTLDRATGEFLWARPTIMQNVIKSIDGATGAVTVNPEALFTKMGETKLICPSAQGGKNWPAGAYNPRTNVMYVPMQNMCGNYTVNTDKRDPSKVYALDFPTIIAPGATNVGTVYAISAETGRTVWKHEQRAGMLSLVATGGGLLLGGDANGRFKAFDERNGRVLWETNLGSPVSGYPITFAIDGKQYVAVATGPSGEASSTLRLTPELRPSTTQQVVVFALP